MAEDISVDALNDDDGKKSPDVGYWISQIEGAKLLSKHSWESAKASWEEMLGPTAHFNSMRDVDRQPVDARYPVWWSSIQTIQPTLYSRTPETVAAKMFEDLNDDVARLSGLGLERLAKYLIQNCAFDRTMEYTRDTFIHASKAAPRVRFDTQISEKSEKVYYIPQQVPVPPAAPVSSPPNNTQQATGAGGPPVAPQPPQFQTIYLNDRGDQFQGDPSKLQQDDKGLFDLEDSLDYECVEILPTHYRDVLHTPNARWEEEITWKAYRSILTRKQYKQQFGDQYQVPFKTIKPDEKTPEDEKLLPVEYAIIWEIWDKETESVKWLAEGYRDSLLTPLNLQDVEDEDGDIYDLDGFFPSPPFILGTCGPDSLFPVPDYVQLRPLIEQLHGLMDRLKVHVLSLKSLGIYDAQVPGLKDALENVQAGQFKALSDFAQLIDDKTPGLDKILRFFPMEEIANTIDKIMQVIQDFEAKFNEIYGVPDIVRGISDPNETADAQQRKGQYHFIRMSTRARAFQRMVRDTIELACDLALKKFTEKKLQDVMGVHFWDPEDQQLWPQVLMLLQDDDERKVRIDIETDSTITQNEEEEIQQATFVAKTLTEGFAAIATATQQNPLFGPPAIAALELVIGKTRYGKYLEAPLRKVKEQLEQQLENPQPPPPDPKIQVEQMKQQGKQQELQGKFQLQQQKQQGDFQIEQAQAQLEQVRAQSDIAIDQNKAQSEIVQHSIESKQKMDLAERMAQLEATVKLLQAHTDMATQQHKTDTDTALAQYEAKQKIQLMNKEAQNAYTEKAPE